MDGTGAIGRISGAGARAAMPSLRSLRDVEPQRGITLQPTQPGVARVNELNVLLIDGARRHLREARLFEKFHDLKRHEDRAFLTSSFEDIYVHLQEYLRTSDRMCMHSSVENRVPFLENQLIDFALHLPVSAKYSRGVSKRIVGHLAETELPGCGNGSSVRFEQYIS